MYTRVGVLNHLLQQDGGNNKKQRKESTETDA